MGGWGQILCNQIVDFVTGDGDFGKFADGQGRGEDYFAVHVRGIGFGAG